MIIFYYSGHGAQARAAVRGTGDGEYDQFVPLPGFDIDRQDPERFIVDKDSTTGSRATFPRAFRS